MRPSARATYFPARFQNAPRHRPAAIRPQSDNGHLKVRLSKEDADSREERC